MILSIAMFAFALVLAFAFFGKAGAAGNFLLEGSQFFIGRVVFALPLFFVFAGLVLWSMKKYSVLLVFLGLFLLTLSASGVLATFARGRREDVFSMGGWLGSLISLPAFTAFGFWVGEIIFLALFAVGGVILWQLLPHEKQEKPSFGEAAKEKVKKIFEPKFEVSPLEPEPKVQMSSSFDSGKGDDPSAQLEQKKKEKRRDAIVAPLGDYKVPPLELLDQEKGAPNAGDVKAYSAIIKKTLQNFDIPVEISEVNVGPAVTQYAFKPAEGIKLSRITALQNDLALALAAHPLRIEAPIPGRALVGVEIPNKIRAVVRLRSLLEHREYQELSALLPLALGKDVSGAPVYADLARMPHLLVAGATGSGKTIGLSNIIMSLVYKNPPSRLRFILVDPKRVEFPMHNDLPHMLTPVIFDTQRTLNALKWLIKEMERRFSVFSEVRVRDLKGYHALAAERQGMEEIPYIVMVIDELADLMAARGKELEGMIVRLAQMARAVGIHLVLATQRPSVEVITGLIKANITSRIAFQVASQVDSRTILDSAGAEKLLGQGDMLFVTAELSKPRRVQGAYISEKEVKRIVEWISRENEGAIQEDMDEGGLAQRAQDALNGGLNDSDDDPLYEEAKRVVVESGKASASLLQRRLKLGYARAARMIDILEERGVVGPADGAKPREVFSTRGRTEQG
ncbi:MAG TPA: cell division protein FtsK, partial [Candidatus Wildermuthbacteria bacterium]|nr:cell division protein FtsK [Candidatus Wildermuthbacteria bacterium]